MKLQWYMFSIKIKTVMCLLNVDVGKGEDEDKYMKITQNVRKPIYK